MAGGTDTGPLEKFLLDYVDIVGGVWQPAEPQVYDVMLPPTLAGPLGLATPDEMIRLAFDPEALADHPHAHLVAFGNPMLDRIFEHAQALGQSARVWLGGFNLSPHDLPSTLRRSLQTPADVGLKPGVPRVYHFTQAIFWFQATFISDEKEHSAFPVGVDLYYGRLARHLEEVLRSAVVSETCPFPYPNAPRISLPHAYQVAREEATRTIAVAASARLAELQQMLQRETHRIRSYFADLRAELGERQARAEAKGEDAARFALRQDALVREEQAQISELTRKMALRVQARLLNVLWVVQPKLRVRVRLASPRGVSGETDVVWDPALQKVEATVCAQCGRPTLALALTRAGAVVCPECAAAPSAKRKA